MLLEVLKKRRALQLDGLDPNKAAPPLAVRVLLLFVSFLLASAWLCSPPPAQRTAHAAILEELLLPSSTWSATVCRLQTRLPPSPS
ncbi:UNVERIFIED_CONTAM: hypothetical protein FKN15_057186 [Acipenser sinensis]